MSEPIWNEFLTERDKQVFAAAGYGARAGFGKRPALLVIDVSWAFTGEKPEPILESIKKWPSSSGEEAWQAVAHIKTYNQCKTRGWLGSRRLELEEKQTENFSKQSRRVRDHRRHRTSSEGFGCRQTKTVRVLRHSFGELFDAAWRGLGDRNRRYDFRMRPRNLRRCF